MVTKEFIVIIIDLIEKSLNGKLSLEEFYFLWPKELEMDEILNEIYNDIENVVEHYPVDIITGKPKSYIFQNSDEYKRLLSYLSVLKGISS